MTASALASRNEMALALLGEDLAELSGERPAPVRAAGLPTCVPETRIGLFDFSRATSTGPAAFVTDRSQWACGVGRLGIARGSSDPGIDEPLAMARAGDLRYFSVDGLGSVVATNDPAGTVTHSVVFDAWGNVKSETGTRTHPFTYTGREVGEAGLHFYRARYYQPGVGRFSQEDPIGFGDGIQMYAYVSNDPASYVDPSGLGKIKWFVRGVKGLWRRVGKKAAERCLADGKEVKAVGRGASGDARKMARDEFGSKTKRHDAHPGTENPHFQHKNGGRGKVYYVTSRHLTAVGLLGDHWYSEVIDLFNPISDAVEIAELVTDATDAALGVKDETCGCE